MLKRIFRMSAARILRFEAAWASRSSSLTMWQAYPGKIAQLSDHFDKR
jgi:hypothetical protein